MLYKLIELFILNLILYLMGKKNNNLKKEKKINKNKEKLNISSKIHKINQKLYSKRGNNLTKINTTIIFKINSNPLLQEEFEKEYNKRFLFYEKEEFNFKLITVFFNFISLSKIIPNSFKNNIYFLKEFLKIIIDLLMNEIDLVTMSLILDSVGWIKEGSDPWIYLYYICLYSKEKSSSKNSCLLLEQILEKNNKGFQESYNKWKNKINFINKLDKNEIIKTNERFRELMKPLNLNDNESKIINYNEIVNIILSSSKKKKRLNSNMNISKNNSFPYNNNNLLFNPPKTDLQMIDTHQKDFNRVENQVKMGMQPNLEIQNNNSFYNDKFLDLSRAGSRNSFLGLSFDGELYKMPSMKFNNK